VRAGTASLRKLPHSRARKRAAADSNGILEWMLAGAARSLWWLLLGLALLAVFLIGMGVVRWIV
jgi:hypothetical protein